MNVGLLKVISLAALSVCAGPVLAHALYLAVNDNGDGSVTVNAAFSTGGNAGFAQVRLEDDNGRVLWSGETSAEGSATFAKPGVPYLIILESGKGHSVEEEGPP